MCSKLINYSSSVTSVYDIIEAYLGWRGVDWCICTETSCWPTSRFLIQPKDCECRSRNSGSVVCSPSLVFVRWGQRTGTDRPCPTSVPCRCNHHSPGCVTSSQYRFPVAIVVILMEVQCRRNDGLLHLTSPRQHHVTSPRQTPGHPRYCSVL